MQQKTQEILVNHILDRAALYLFYCLIGAKINSMALAIEPFTRINGGLSLYLLTLLNEQHHIVAFKTFSPTSYYIIRYCTKMFHIIIVDFNLKNTNT